MILCPRCESEDVWRSEKCWCDLCGFVFDCDEKDYFENHLSSPQQVTFMQQPLPGLDLWPKPVKVWVWDIGEPEGTTKDRQHA